MVIMLDLPTLDKENIVVEESLKDLITPYIKEILKEPDFEDSLRQKGLEVID